MGGSRRREEDTSHQLGSALQAKGVWGVELRRAKGMHKALLAKLGWRMITRKDELWAKMLRNKYGLMEDGPVVFRKKQRASSTWRGLEWAGELLSRGLRWMAKGYGSGWIVG